MTQTSVMLAAATAGSPVSASSRKAERASAVDLRRGLGVVFMRGWKEEGSPEAAARGERDPGMRARVAVVRVLEPSGAGPGPDRTGRVGGG